MTATYAQARRASRHYQQIGLETEVLGASPQRLISLLLRAALAAMHQARHHLRQGDVQARGAAISKAIDIVESGLKAGIDTERGGALAQSLLASYALIIHHLILANLRSSEPHLDIAEKTLGPIAQAWQSAIDPTFRGLDTPSDPASNH